MREELKHYSTYILFVGSLLDIVAYALDATGEYIILSGAIKVLALVAKFIPQRFTNECKSD